MTAPDRIFAWEVSKEKGWAYGGWNAEPGNPSELYLRATPELLALIEEGKNEPRGIGPEYEAWRDKVHSAARSFIRAFARTQEST